MTQIEELKQHILAQMPTDQQRDAIFAKDLEYILRASPGSGKTWTSCRRFIWRAANWDYKAGGLALLSFTNTAISEFYQATVGVGRRDLLSNPNYIGTFDSFIERFVISPFGHLPSGSPERPKLFLAPRPGDWVNAKLQCWTTMKDGSKRPIPAWEIIPFPDNGKVAFKASSSYGGKTLTFNQTNPVAQLLRLGFYTHQQRAYLAFKILLNRPHIAHCLARRFPEIIVDEAQDTNVWLIIILNFLREKGMKVSLVGDPDQCIYEFGMADATSLPALKEKWRIREMPLSRSFRCNTAIAQAVRHISGNSSFDGCGDSLNELCLPIIVRCGDARNSDCVTLFQTHLERAGILQDNSAVLCRAHEQLEAIRGVVSYTALQGLTKEMAHAAFHRDVRKDYKKTFQIVRSTIRKMIDEPSFWDELDNNPESETSVRFKLALWQFSKTKDYLPGLEESAIDWITKLRANLGKLFLELGISNIPNLGHKLKTTGLDKSQLAQPLFQPDSLFPPIRQETIHQVKGESIDAVLLLGSTKFFNSLISAIEGGQNSEERRLAYVAMTRARHVLMVGLPAAHFDKYASKWSSWGFTTT